MFDNLSNKKLGMIAAGILVFVIVLAIIYMANQSNNIENGVPVAHNSFADTHQAVTNSVENFAAIVQADYDNFKKAAQASDGLTEDKKREILGLLGCQNAINQNMQGYRSAESGATFKVEEVKDITTNASKYIIHAADDLVLAVDNVTGRLSRAVKNTKDPAQLFDREDVIEAGKAIGTFMFTKALTSGIKFGIQYEHESLSLRPLNKPDPAKPAVPYGRGQQFTFDANLKGDLLDAAAMALGYRIAPAVGASDLQNAGSVAMCGAGSGSSTPVTTKAGGAAPNQSLCSLTEKQFNDAIAAAVANISAFNTSAGSAQPGTQNNPFANKPVKFNVNLSGISGQSSSTGSAPKGIVSGFADIPNGDYKETFANVASSGSGTGQVRSLIQAWDASQNPGPDTDLGGFPASAGTLGNALRGKMVSCPKIDRTQYYTERQLSQCAGCTPDAYLRGQLGGSVFS
jgi:hypothetical protein